jgi:hypothetical protein
LSRHTLLATGTSWTACFAVKTREISLPMAIHRFLAAFSGGLNQIFSCSPVREIEFWKVGQTP